MTQVVGIVGDYYHDVSNYRAFLSERAANVGLVVEHRTIDDLAQVLAEKPDLLVIAHENRLNPADEEINYWLTPELDAGLVDFVHGGGNIMVWHTGLASYPVDSGYIKMLRGYFVSHPQAHPQVQYDGDSDWFGQQHFDFEDEQYYVHVDEENTNVFLRSASVLGRSEAAWTHEFGQGRVLCLCPTHTKYGFANPGFQALYEKCLNFMK